MTGKVQTPKVGMENVCSEKSQDGSQPLDAETAISNQKGMPKLQKMLYKIEQEYATSEE